MERVKRRTPELTPRLALFGPPLLIEGEDAATYDDLLAHMLAAVKPVDVIDEMLIVDVASLEWEVLRCRRLKTSLIQARGLKALEHFLDTQIDYDLFRISRSPIHRHAYNVRKHRQHRQQRPPARIAIEVKTISTAR